MGRHPASTQYIIPYDTADGTQPVAAAGDTKLGTSNVGVVTLTASHTYVFPVGIQDAQVISMKLRGDDAIVITSATVEDEDEAGHETSDYSDLAGEWLATPPALIESTAEGTGWSATSDVGAALGGNAGAVAWKIVHHGGRRMRVKVVVGAAGGEVRFSAWGKE